MTMNLIKGNAKRQDAGNTNPETCWISESRNLIIFANHKPEENIRRFAVKQRTYQIGTEPLYLSKIESGIRYTTDRAGEERTGKYDIFEKPNDVELPNKCIENAAHVLKCMKENSHYTGLIDNGDPNLPAVYMEVGPYTDRKKYDIDEEDMNDKSREVFKNHPSFRDARSESFAVGEGMALVFSLPKNQRKVKENEFLLHAVAVVLKDNDNKFMVVVEKFADDDEMLDKDNKWELNAYSGAAGFISDWSQAFPSDLPKPRFRFWKLTAHKRETIFYRRR